MRSCAVDGCARPHKAKGLCGTHYAAQMRSDFPCRNKAATTKYRLSHPQQRNDWRKRNPSKVADSGRRQRQKQSGAYRSWRAMIQRCTDKNAKAYRRYGASGITICQRWRDFKLFLLDMGERPAGKTLDRFPQRDGNYEPSNCRWATPREQRRNQLSRLISLTFDGKTMLLTEWAKRTGLSDGTLYQRLFYRKWPIEKALTVPTRNRKS